MKLKYPIRKYLLPWSLIAVNIFVLIRLGNQIFTMLALISTLLLYGVLHLATKQIEKKDEAIAALKKLISEKGD